MGKARLTAAQKKAEAAAAAATARKAAVLEDDSMRQAGEALLQSGLLLLLQSLLRQEHRRRLLIPSSRIGTTIKYLLLAFRSFVFSTLPSVPTKERGVLYSVPTPSAEARRVTIMTDQITDDKPLEAMLQDRNREQGK